MEMKMPEKRTYPIAVDEKLHNDLEDIKGILENQTGMVISNTNILRALVKTWYNVNNNG